MTVNKSDMIADYQFWVKFEKWNLEQMTALFLGYNPLYFDQKLIKDLSNGNLSTSLTEDETDDLPVATDAGEDDDEYEYVYVDEAGNIVDDADADDEEEDDEWIDEDEGVDDEDLDEEQPDDVDIDDAYEYVWVDDDGNIIEGEEDEEDEDEQWEVH